MDRLQSLPLCLAACLAGSQVGSQADNQVGSLLDNQADNLLVSQVDNLLHDLVQILVLCHLQSRLPLRL